MICRTNQNHLELGEKFLEASRIHYVIAEYKKGRERRISAISGGRVATGGSLHAYSVMMTAC